MDVDDEGATFVFHSVCWKVQLSILKNTEYITHSIQWRSVGQSLVLSSAPLAAVAPKSGTIRWCVTTKPSAAV